jgi:CRP-like cAMP-binding protein
MLRLVKGGPEQRAVDAGEIDAIIDYANRNVILLPAAQRALQAAADRAIVNEFPVGNTLLAALPPVEYRRLLPDLEPVTLKFGDVLEEPGEPIAHVHFPIDCAICLLAKIDGHQPPEVGLVGYEGMVGVSLALGVGVSSVRALVEGGGKAMRMSAARFQALLGECPSLQRELHRFTYAKLAVARQAVACIWFHTGEARLARWLLMTSDRLRSKEFFLTQNFLADMLGVQRTTLNVAAGPLKRRGLITYTRGRIRILDRRGLEAASCRCYSRIKGSTPPSIAN